MRQFGLRLVYPEGRLGQNNVGWRLGVVGWGLGHGTWSVKTSVEMRTSTSELVFSMRFMGALYA